MNSIMSVFGSSVITADDCLQVMNSLIETHEEKFMVLDVEEVVRRYEKWVETLPRVTPFYAVKCNNHPTVIKTLALMGASFDCASGAEIKQICSYGVDSSRIIFAQPCKMKKDLLTASKKGVSMMTFDSEAELFKIKSQYPEAELLIRIRCDSDSVQCALGIKFGVCPSQAFPLLVTAKKLDLKVVGVAFHVGSGCSEPSIFTKAISESRRVFDQAVETGHSPHILDIGGGFLSGPYSHLEDAASYINSALSVHFPEESGVRVIAEPGRYMVASAFSLCTPVINSRKVSVSGADIPKSLHLQAEAKEVVDSTMYFIDDGVYGTFNCILYDHSEVTPKVLRKKLTSDQLHLSSIWGPTCDGLDQVMSAVMLPHLSLGDWILWENMGAYTLVAAGKFNGIPLPKKYTVISEAVKRRLEERAFNLNEEVSHMKKARRALESPLDLKGMTYGDYVAAALDSLSINSDSGRSSTDSRPTSVYSSFDEAEQ